MSQENVEIARQVLTAVEKRDTERLIALADPELEWQSFFAVLAQGGQYRGHAGLRRYFRDLDESFELLNPTVDGFIATGEVAIAVGHLRYRGRESGLETEVPAGWMFRFRNGKLLRFRAFRDPEQVLEAAGLRE
jgi:ketosteroid isomerase-like protein